MEGFYWAVQLCCCGVVLLFVVDERERVVTRRGRLVDGGERERGRLVDRDEREDDVGLWLFAGEGSGGDDKETKGRKWENKRESGGRSLPEKMERTKHRVAVVW
ncbi:hypothetical protein HAX54_045980 [Datura stramonium]|uniref:Uncharacterized protein n=1 Tax=Datura stramonium TaxID=4076 RepID=A0ABS8RRA0_DATST|nr:hypothetical protein [Datura stramonium]